MAPYQVEEVAEGQHSETAAGTARKEITQLEEGRNPDLPCSKQRETVPRTQTLLASN